MATTAGFEPATNRLEGDCSIRLSYTVLMPAEPNPQDFYKPKQIVLTSNQPSNYFPVPILAPLMCSGWEFIGEKVKIKCLVVVTHLKALCFQNAFSWRPLDESNITPVK